MNLVLVIALKKTKITALETTFPSKTVVAMCTLISMDSSFFFRLVEDAYQRIVKDDRFMSTNKVLAGIVMSSGVHVNQSQCNQFVSCNQS